MSQVKIQGNASGTGIFTVASPNSNTDRTLTLPQADATLAINGPAFSAYNSSSQTLSSLTLTKIQFNTEEFDTSSCYDTSTYRFTPNVAGYYQITVCVGVAATGSSVANTQLSNVIYKNGSVAKFGGQTLLNNTYDMITSVSALIYLNGSTDYVEGYVRQISGGSLGTNADAPYCYFQGVLVRAA